MKNVTANRVVRLLLTLALVAIVGAASLGASRNRGAKKEAEALAKLAASMTGSFSSRAHAEADPEFRAVRLTMTPIWAERTDGPWLYVEQALESSLGRPYRQRVYHLLREGRRRFESVVFSLPEEERFVGAGQKPGTFDGIGPERLVRREGCVVHLRQLADGTYSGGTRGNECRSDLRGASYATSEVEISESELRSWDRGFDAEGKQVWGATKGPYVFKRIEP